MRAFVISILLLAAIFAHGEMGSGVDALDIIQNSTPCSQLSDEQLEAIGEYYMEQMHPGQQHVMMDNMMGGEGSTSLKEAHIAMAQRIYCGDDTVEPPFSLTSSQEAKSNDSLLFLAAGLGLGALAVFLLKK